MDRDDIEMLFRCLMQFARHIAKKHGFTIKAYEPPPAPEMENHAT